MYYLLLLCKSYWYSLRRLFRSLYFESFSVNWFVFSISCHFSIINIKINKFFPSIIKLFIFSLHSFDLLIYNSDFLLIFHLAVIEILIDFWFFLSIIWPFFISVFIINGSFNETKHFGTLFFLYNNKLNY